MALIKYGHDNFTFEIIKYCEPKEAVILEQTYLDKYDFDYNINVKANSILGYKHTAETLEKMKGRQNFKGKTHSAETIQGIINRANIKRQQKQLNNKIKLSKLFKKVSSDSKIIRFGSSNVLSIGIKITDILNNQSIIINSLTYASLLLCASPNFLKKIIKSKTLFSYFELNTLNNCLIERKLLISFEK